MLRRHARIRTRSETNMAKTSKKDESTQNKSAQEKSSKSTDKSAETQEIPAQAIPNSSGLKGPAVETRKAVKTSNIKTRTEEDLLGKLEVPEDAYYGVHTMRALDNFQISYVTVNSIPEFIRGMVMVKKATAMANRRLHTLPKKKAEAIVWACDQILEEGRCMDQFPLDGFQGDGGTSTNMNSNELIASLALEYLGEKKRSYERIHPTDDVNMSQSTNDAYPTGFRLGLYFSSNKLIERIDALQDSLAAKGNEFQDILKMGRTQLQDAVPMTLGDEFQAFARNLQEEQAV